MKVWKWGGVAAFVSCFLLAFVAVAGPAQALLKVKLGDCPVGIATVDPIKFFQGAPDQGHPHQFYGNQTPVELGNYTTDADMLNAVVPCQTIGDTAGYWSPVVSSRDPVTGELVPVQVQQFTAYYRAASGANQGPAQPIPAGAHLIAHIYNWTCGQKSGARSAPSSVFPDCRGLSGKPGLTLTSHITFPSCWDGLLTDHTVAGNTDDSAHFAYPVRKVCPAGFPVGVAQLKETVQYRYVGDPAALVLSSDEMDGTSLGRSLHGDFMSDWQQGAQETALGRCVTPAKQAKGCG